MMDDLNCVMHAGGVRADQVRWEGRIVVLRGAGGLYNSFDQSESNDRAFDLFMPSMSQTARLLIRNRNPLKTQNHMRCSTVKVPKLLIAN
jgi:hypothetical protein